MTNSTSRVLSIGIGGDRFTDGLWKDLREDGTVSYVAGVIDQHQNHAPFDRIVAYFSQGLFGDYDWPVAGCPPVDDALYRSINHAEGNLLRQMDRLLYEPLSKTRARQFTGTFDDRRRLLFDHIRFWDSQLRELAIDVVVFHNVPHQIFDTVIYHLSQSRGIPTLLFNTVGAFRDSIFCSETIDDLGLLSLGATIHSAEIGMWRDSSERVSRDWERICQEVDGNLMSRPLTRKYSLITSIANDGHIGGDALSPSLLARALGRRLGRRFHRRRELRVSFRHKFRRLRDIHRTRREELSAATHVIPSERFIYFPLHFQPEATTSAKGRHYVEQEEVVNSIVAHLPSDVRLVLKEHPHQFEKLLPRARNFYKRLVVAPTVVLVSSDVPSVELRKRCLAVVTVSGSNGFEVLASGKPVIAFGSAPWREAPGVHTVRSNLDVQRAIAEVLVANEIPRDAYLGYLENLRAATWRGDLSGPTGGRPGHELAELATATRHNIGLVIRTWLRLRRDRD
jgi:hypothetical protein